MKALYMIVGMKHRDADAFVKSLRDGEPLKLIREPDNPHDHFAIQVWAQQRHIAYIKGTEAPKLARHIERIDPEHKIGITGKLVNRGWPHVEVEE